MTHFAVEDRNQVLMGPVISIALTPDLPTMVSVPTIRQRPLSPPTNANNRVSISPPSCECVNFFTASKNLSAHPMLVHHRLASLSVVLHYAYQRPQLNCKYSIELVCDTTARK